MANKSTSKDILPIHELPNDVEVIDSNEEIKISNTIIQAYSELSSDAQKILFLTFFKGFIKTIENSNIGYVWDWDETKLKGKKVCGVFQYEEYEKQDGTRGIKVRLNKFRSLDKLKDIEVSDSIKMLDGSYVSYDDYMERKEDKFADFKDIVEINESDLPF